MEEISVLVSVIERPEQVEELTPPSNAPVIIRGYEFEPEGPASLPNHSFEPGEEPVVVAEVDYEENGGEGAGQESRWEESNERSSCVF